MLDSGLRGGNVEFARGVNREVWFREKMILRILPPSEHRKIIWITMCLPLE